MPTLKAKLFSAASATVALQALLGTSPFRWYDEQLPQSTAFPAVVVHEVDAPPDYSITGRMSTYWARIQFTIYGTGNDSENASAVASALADFLATFNAIGVSGLPVYPNRILNNRDAGLAQTQPMTYQRIIDVQVMNDERF